MRNDFCATDHVGRVQIANDQHPAVVRKSLVHRSRDLGSIH